MRQFWAVCPTCVAPDPAARRMNDAHGELGQMTSTKHSSRSPSPRCPPVWVTGEIDIATAPRVRRALARAVPDSSGQVIVDLSGVTFMDCSGLGPLLEAETRLGGRLSLRGVPAKVAALLHLAGLQGRFRLTDAAAGTSVPTRPAGDLQRGGSGAAGILELEDKVASQRARVSGRARIDQAKGLVMATHGCDAEQAWQMLFRASRAKGVQVHDLADALAEAAAGRDMDQSSDAMRAAVLAVMAPRAVHDDAPRPEDQPPAARNDARLPSSREATEAT